MPLVLYPTGNSELLSVLAVVGVFLMMKMILNRWGRKSAYICIVVLIIR